MEGQHFHVQNAGTVAYVIVCIIDCNIERGVDLFQFMGLIVFMIPFKSGFYTSYASMNGPAGI
jgi:hypothetical protein